MQREAYFLSIPCITLRDETELTETVNALEFGQNYDRVAVPVSAQLVAI